MWSSPSNLCKVLFKRDIDAHTTELYKQLTILFFFDRVVTNLNHFFFQQLSLETELNSLLFGNQ